MADDSGTGADATGGSDEAPAPLTEKEIAQVKRLFSDPFSIPLEFKAWLVAYLETNPPLLTAASIFGFRSTVQQQIAAASAGVPVGTVVAYIGSVDPDAHWLLCDGRLLDRTTYAVLYARIGFTYSPVPGTDPGANKFYLPDLVGRYIHGLGTRTEISALGKSDGLLAAVRGAFHKHVLGREVVSLTPGATAYSIYGNMATKDITTEDLTASATNTASFLTMNHIIYVG